MTDEERALIFLGEDARLLASQELVEYFRTVRREERSDRAGYEGPVVAAAIELQDFMSKMVQAGLLEIKAEETTANGLMERLQALKDAIDGGERDGNTEQR